MIGGTTFFFFCRNGIHYDVALIKIEGKILWTDNVRPVCLPTPGTYISNGTVCIATGWGSLCRFIFYYIQIIEPKVILFFAIVASSTILFKVKSLSLIKTICVKVAISGYRFSITDWLAEEMKDYLYKHAQF